jgi:hypothetical protein
VARAATRAGSLRWVLPTAHLAASVLLLWLCFFLLGKTLLAIPSSFHEGEAWKSLRLPQ